MNERIIIKRVMDWALVVKTPGLTALLSSVLEHEPDAMVFAYDLGLTEAENEHLRCSFRTVVFRTFDYSRYPNYFNVKNQQGQYACKPVILWKM